MAYFTSNYTTAPTDWEERKRVMLGDLADSYYDYLYFKIVLSLNDARDNNDYERHELLLKILKNFKDKNYPRLYNLIAQLA